MPVIRTLSIQIRETDDAERSFPPHSYVWPADGRHRVAQPYCDDTERFRLHRQYRRRIFYCLHHPEVADASDGERLLTFGSLLTEAIGTNEGRTL